MPIGPKNSAFPKGRLIRSDREERGLSQDALASLSGRFSVETLRRAEKAENRISIEYLEYIALALEMPMDRYVVAEHDGYIRLFGNLVETLKGSVIEQINLGPPRSQNLDRDASKEIYHIISKLAVSIFHKLRANEGKYLFSDDLDDLNFRRSCPPVLICPPFSMHISVDYLAFMDDVVLHYGFGGDFPLFCNMLVGNEDLISSGKLIIVPSK